MHRVWSIYRDTEQPQQKETSKNESWLPFSGMQFSDLLMFYELFFLPQVKQCAIITYKHGIYERFYQPQKEN